MQKQILRNIIEKRYQKTTSRDNRVQKMLADLDEEIQIVDAIDVFILTCENIMLPLHQTIANIPNDDKEFTLNITKTPLTEKLYESMIINEIF